MRAQIRGLRRHLDFWLKSRIAQVRSDAIIILGKEKSGTSAIAQLLGEMTDRETVIDIPPIWGRREIAIQQGDVAFDKFVKRHRFFFSKPIIKEPALTFFFPAVKRTFPDARYVLIVRDPRESIRSVCNRLELPGNLSRLDEPRWNRIPANWRLVLDDRVNGCPRENYIAAQSHRWNRAADVYLQNPDDILLVRYEEFQADKLHYLEQLAGKLGLTPVRNIADRLNVQFQPRGRAEADLEEFFGPQNLQQIEEICGSRMARLGYQSGRSAPRAASADSH